MAAAVDRDSSRRAVNQVSFDFHWRVGPRHRWHQRDRPRDRDRVRRRGRVPSPSPAPQRRRGGLRDRPPRASRTGRSEMTDPAVDRRAGRITRCARRAREQRRCELPGRPRRVGARHLRDRDGPQPHRSDAPHDRVPRPAAGQRPRRRGESVVSVVSMAAFRSIPIVPGYGSAKAGLVALTRNLARQWVGDGIRVNAVAPGVIDTPMTAPLERAPRAPRRRAGSHPDGPVRHPRRGRADGPVPGQLAARLHHRRDHVRRRRLPHGLIMPTLASALPRGHRRPRCRRRARQAHRAARRRVGTDPPPRRGRVPRRVGRGPHHADDALLLGRPTLPRAHPRDAGHGVGPQRALEPAPRRHLERRPAG